MASKKVTFTEKQIETAWNYARICSVGLNVYMPIWGKNPDLDDIRRLFVRSLADGIPKTVKVVRLSDASVLVSRDGAVWRIAEPDARMDVRGTTAQELIKGTDTADDICKIAGMFA